MKNFKGTKKQTVYAKVYTKDIVVIDNMTRKYSQPKIHIPKDPQGKPTLSKPWYVYYYYINPYTGKKNRQPIIVKKGINRFKTIKERKEFGNKLINLLIMAFESGWSPYAQDEMEAKGETNQKLQLIDAINYAYEKKIPDWKEKTRQDIEGRKNAFIKWLKENHYDLYTLEDFSRKLLSNFLNHIASTTSNRNSNNFKSAISTLISKLVDDGYLENNVLLNMKKRATKPKKHKAFTPEELTKIKNYLIKNDLNLYYFMCFVGYGFLRNVEVCRLRNKSFDLTNWTMSIETKTETFETIRVIETLKPIVKELKITGKGNKFIFTPEGKIGDWATSERDKVGFFGKRFKKVKEALKLDENHTIYSMRHTFAVNIYNQHLKNGLTDREAILKMLPVTRHKNESGLRNYLRSVNAFVANDYSNDISIDF